MKNDVEAEIIKKISNLKTRIEKKHTDPTVLQNNSSAYIKILENIENKDFYLSKKSPTVTLMKQIKASTLNFEKQKNNLIENQRKKIRQFNNELLLLNNYISIKNKMRAIKVKAQDESSKENLMKKLHLFKTQEAKNQLNSDSFNEENNNSINYNRSNPFQGVKIEKFLEIFKEYKNRQKSDSKSEQKIKFPGIGIENTPIYNLECQDKHEQKSGGSKSKPKFNKSKIKMLGETIDKIYLRNKKMFQSSKEEKKLFQNRLQKIMKIENQFWNKSNFL